MNWPIDKLEECAPGELRCAHVIWWIYLIFPKRISAKGFEHVGKNTYIVEQIKAHIISQCGE